MKRNGEQERAVCELCKREFIKDSPYKTRCPECRRGMALYNQRMDKFRRGKMKQKPDIKNYIGGLMGEAEKVTPKRGKAPCRKCFHGWRGNGGWYCGYILDMGKMRGCEPTPDCEKFRSCSRRKKRR